MNTGCILAQGSFNDLKETKSYSLLRMEMEDDTKETENIVEEVHI